MQLKPSNWANSVDTRSGPPRWVITAILLLAGGLCLYQLSTESVWIDEMLSIQGAEKFDWTKPNVRPLYFILLRFWMRFGESDAWLRSLSVVFHLGGIVLIYQLGRRMLGNGVGLLAAMAMTLSPLFINHAQEIRMYTLSTCLTLAGTLALANAMDTPKRSTLVGWALARTGAILTTPINILLLFTDSLLFGWKFRRQRRWLVAFGCGLLFIGAVFLPPAFLLTFGGKADDFMQKQVADYAKPGIAQILGMPLQFAVYYPLRYLLESNKIVLSNDQLGDASLLSNFFSANALSLFFYGIIGVILLGLMGVALMSLPQRDKPENLLAIAAWGIIPAAGMLCASYLKNSIWFPRYLLFVAPYFLLLMAVGLVWVWQRWRVVAIVITLAYVVAVGGGLRDYYSVLYRNDWQGAAQTIRSAQQPGDVLLFYSIPRFQDESLSRYYHGSMPIHFLERPGQGRQDSKQKSEEEELEFKPEAIKQALEKALSFLDRSEKEPKETEQKGKKSKLPALELAPETIKQALGKEFPVKSRLWLVCWLLDLKQSETDRIFNTLFGNKFQIVKRQTFASMENAPIEVFLVQPQSPVRLPKSNSPQPSSP